MIRRLFLALVLVSGAALAAEIDDRAEREQIRQRREVVEAQHVQRQAECHKRFAVTACLDKARLERHDALAALREQELALDDAQRRVRTEAQARRLAEKSEKSQRPPKPSAAASPASAPRSVREPRPAKSPKPAPADRSAEERAARARFDARQQEIRAHREEIEKRNAKKPAKTAIPLPLPAGASSP
jgi:hypothetical protein